MGNSQRQEPHLIAPGAFLADVAGITNEEKQETVASCH
jgi:hypothetical protein